MCIKKFNLILILVLILTQNSKEFRFRRKIEAIGSPYYKIIMSLGSCTETVLFVDQKIWDQMLLNRVLDISFKCDKARYKVSRVEIALVINNTSTYAYSEEGVGYSDFFATLYLPTNLDFVFYSLTIYSCYKQRESAEITVSKLNMGSSYLPFLHKDNHSDQYNDRLINVDQYDYVNSDRN